MKAFVITIDIPESHEVAEKCISSGKTYGVTVEKHMGVTPADNPTVLAAKLNIPTNRFRERYSRYENCLSAFLSHHSLWQWSVDNQEEVLILEHDAIFIDEVPRVPYKGILSIGAPSYGKFNTPTSIGLNRLVSKQYLPGAHAYIVNPNAAQILLNTARVSPAPTDLFICNALFDFVEEYYPWPVLVRDNFSTIQLEDGCLAKHRYSESYKVL